MKRFRKKPAICVLGAQDSSASIRPLLLALIVAVGAISLAVHWPALSAKAISFDDDQYLIDNPLVRHPSWANAGRFLSEVMEPSTVEGYYQPLTMISLMLDVVLGGRPDHLRTFHCTSLLLHVANTGLIILLLYQLLGNVWAAAAVGLLFGVHPLGVEPIPWIGERKTLLAALFAILALNAYACYARGGRRLAYGLSLTCLLLAMLSKPTSTPLPLVMLLLDFWPLRRLRLATVLEKAPFFLLAVTFAVITIISQGRTAAVVMPTSYPAWHIPVVLCHNVAFYLQKMVWPMNLSSHYPVPESFNLANTAILGSMIGTAILLLLLSLSLWKTRAIATGWLIFFVAILPTMQVISFTDVLACDKYAYLPVIGLLFTLTWLFGKWVPVGQPCRVARRFAFIATILVLATAESVATRHTLAHWRDTETYFKHMLSIAPRALPLHLNLGAALAEQGRLEEAMQHYLEAERSDPQYPKTYYNIGQVLALQNRLEEAVGYYAQALRLRPEYVEAHCSLAKVMVRLGRFEEAVAHYTEALRIAPANSEVHNDLGNILAQSKRYDEAVFHFTEALRINPHYAEAHNGLGGVLMLQGQPDGAIAQFHEALRLKAAYADAHYNLAVVLAQRQQYDEAIAHFEAVLQQEPSSAPMHLELASLLAELGRTQEAIDHLRSAIKTSPASPQAYCWLGNLLSEQGRVDEAIEQYQQALQTAPDFPEAIERLKAALSRKNASAPSPP